jgi:hypothetical protein
MFTPCSPESNGLTQQQIDKLIFSTTKTKTDKVKEWCAVCPATAECLASAIWYNLEGELKHTEGVFGGLTQEERRLDLTTTTG